MSSSEFSKSSTVIESNIPVPKRTFAAAKRSKNCAQLPELQKYIETIIRASNEDAATSEKGKLSRERKSGKYPTYKTIDKKSKLEMTKIDCQMSGRKNKNKAKGPLTEAVSSGDEISCIFLSVFDDPRNWKTDETQNDGGSQPAVENCLKKLFPNPYHLANLSELRNVISVISPEKDEKDKLGDETLAGIPHSNAFTQTEVQSRKADDELVTADNEIEPCERASYAACAISLANEVENIPRPVSRKGGPRGGNPLPAPRKTLTKFSQTIRSSSTVNISSRASSLDSVSDVCSSHTRTMTPKHKNSKSTLHSGKSSTNELNPKSSVEDFLDDLSSDYDIGKLRLLSMTDSDESIVRTVGKNDSATTGICEAEDIKDLREIFDVMDKATESFLEMSLKNSGYGGNDARNKKVLQLLDELIGEKITSSQNEGVVLEEIKEELSEKEETKPKTREIELRENEEKLELTVPDDHSEDKDELKFTPQVDNSAEEGNSSKVEEEPGEKMDEVLEFMYDCLKKFNNQEKKQSEEFLLEDKKEESATKLRKPGDACAPNGSFENLSVSNHPRVKEIQSESSTFLADNKRKLMWRPRSRIKQDKNSLVGPTRSTTSRPPTAARSLDMNSRADSIETTNDNLPQTVESQNELGSYSEQAQVQPDLHTAKPILPHSVKLKKNKTDTHKSIKDALDNEEKLLASYINSKPKILEKTGESKSRKLVVRNGRTGSGYSLLNDFKRTNSSFVICVSSLPRNLRTMAANKTSITFSPSLSLSLSDISRHWCIKPLPYYTTMSLKKVPVVLDVPQSAVELSYNKSEGTLLMIDTGLVKHIARPVCLKQTVSCSTVRDEVSLKHSKCSVNVRLPPMKKSLSAESSTGGSTVGVEETGAGGNQGVDSILEALEKTEGRLMLLEQNELINSESSSTSGNDTSKCDNSELEWENDNGHEKVHELLLRTYNLQQKLHRYLHKMSVMPPVCPLMKGRSVSVKERKSEDTPSKTDEGTTMEIEKSDHATSYSPPPEDTKSLNVEKMAENEDDDASSVYSFKSSNDFSESNEIPMEKSAEKTRNGDFFKKIFNEIESFRQNFTSDKKEVQSTVESNQENRLTEYDPKTPAKVLKTVFKGKKSTTELTIGLKDVPMTKVSNISVEKRKFSPNHTKISICILKEKPEALEKSNSIQETFKPDSSFLRNKFSTLYFDRIRPSLSRCRTEYSRVEDDISKMSASTNDSDDDDDFKSVASSFSNSEIVAEQEVPSNTRQPATSPPPKTFTKYRFDFYRKMDLSLDQTKPKPLSSTLCRYKELQPLKEALTEMQIRMRSIKHDTYIGNDYYERALKLAKMSAGYCQSCGNRAVIPKDTFGYYKTLLPRRCPSHRQSRHVKMGGTSPSSFYSFRSSNPEMSESFCELDVNHSSPYLLNHTRRSSGAYLRSSLHNMPILIGRM